MLGIREYNKPKLTMPKSTKSKPTKRQYRIRNWKEYDAALKQRGSLTFWVSEDVLANWLASEKTGRPGASNTYSDVAIATMATVQSQFHLARRQSEGFLQSWFKLMGVQSIQLVSRSMVRENGRYGSMVGVKGGRGGSCIWG